MKKNMKKILDELIFVGYSMKHIGTIMLAESISIVQHSKNLDIINDLENNVYSQIAEKYNTNIQVVKGNIVNATNYMYNETDVNKVKEYFTFYEDTKPTPKLVINTVLRKIE